MSCIADKEYQKYVPKGYKLYLYHYQDYVLFYINTTELTVTSLKKQLDILPACVSANIEDKEIAIISLHSSIKGCGTLLLYAVILYAYHNFDVENITLDDMSDRFGMQNNIYIKLGMKYIEPCMPEMIGSVKYVSRKWRRYKQKRNKTLLNHIHKISHIRF